MADTVEAILWRVATSADFFNIERSAEAGPAGGGGQTYIDIPLGGNLTAADLWDFIGVSPPLNLEGDWPKRTLTAGVLGDPGVEAAIEFAPRRAGGGRRRYKISNQNRQVAGAARHPAWTEQYGFPKAPDDIESKDDPRLPDLSYLKYVIVKTVDGRFYAGFTNSDDIPAEWPTGVGLEALFEQNDELQASRKTIGLISGIASNKDVPDVALEVVRGWRRNPNVLLYGPPGTGKTFAMQALWDIVTGETGLQRLEVDASDAASPFSLEGEELPFVTPAHRVWSTFHQSYSYEDFVLALRPRGSVAEFRLQPRLGVLLDAATRVDENVEQPEEGRAGAATIFIDEVNRGNVSRIFGEFITFMEPEYRATLRGAANSRALPVPLQQLGTEDIAGVAMTEEVERVDGTKLRLPVPWMFPEGVFVVSSMNSVDRAVAPLDTALARRFTRIELAPDMNALAHALAIDDPFSTLEALGRTRAALEGGGEDVGVVGGEEEREEAEEEEGAPGQPLELSVGEIAWLLLYRLNFELAALLGADFELGHTYMFGVANETPEDARLLALVRAWDQAIYPQLRERFVNRPDQLLRVLRLGPDNPIPPKGFLLRLRMRPPGSQAEGYEPDVLASVVLERELAMRPDEVRLTLRYLAGA
jgi:hypothetical protein